MPKIEDGCYGSLKGIALIAKVLAGRCRMHYTRVAAGKGTMPEDLTPKTLTEPPEYVMDAMISSVTNPVDGECQVSVQINSANVENGFYCTWLILYAEDPDEGEIPFTALCLENEPEWIRPASSIVGKLAHFDIIAAVGDVDNVSAAIDPDALVTREDLEKLSEKINIALENISGTITLDLTIPAEGWETVEEDAADTGEPAGLRVDILNEVIRADMTPVLTILPAYTSIAASCGLNSAARTLDGALRVYAEKVPEEEMMASLALSCMSGGAGGGSGAGYVLPVATADRLGGVKIGPGFSVEADGTISVDGVQVLDSAIAPDSSAEEMLDSVFGSDEEQGS